MLHCIHTCDWSRVHIIIYILQGASATACVAQQPYNFHIYVPILYLVENLYVEGDDANFVV